PFAPVDGLQDPPCGINGKRPAGSFPPSEPPAGQAPPRRPVCAPGDDRPIVPQTNFEREDRTMSLHGGLRNLRSSLAPGRGQRNAARGGSLRKGPHRPYIEAMEDRTVPAFLAPVESSAGIYPLDVKAGDFNGDRILDLATVNYVSRDVSILLGNADGTFQP